MRIQDLSVDELPVEIRDSSRAVVWKTELRNGKLTKVPYCCTAPNRRASVTNSRTWGSFREAMQTVQAGHADGAGIVLGQGLVGIDLDHCREPKSGSIDPTALAVVDQLQSYAELSPSRTGIHVLVWGKLPRGRRRAKGLEVYDRARYFTVTGQHLRGSPREIRESTALFDWYVRQFPSSTKRASASTQPLDLDDTELLQRAQAAVNGARFAALWRGDRSGHGDDDSAADLALANVLAFWTGREATRMDRLFRQSGLMRPKWTSRRGASTYGAQTIQKAIEGCSDIYTAPITITIDEDTKTPTEPQQPDSWPVLDSAALYGLLGDTVRALEPITEADPVALLGHLAVSFGNLIGRGPHIRVGAVVHHLNEFSLFVGDTSDGRKGQAEADSRSVMAPVDSVWADTRILGGLSSGEGLIYSVRDPDQVREDAGVDDKRAFVVESEFAKVLRVSRREGSTLSATLRQAWDTGTLRVLTRTNPLTATDSHISVVGHITPMELRQELKTIDMANGFLNRFLILLVRRRHLLPEGGQLEPTVREHLVKRWIEARTHAQGQGEITRNAEAAEYWADLYKTLTQSRPGLVGALSSRGSAHVLRLSLLYALADLSTRMRVEHIQAAAAVWRYADRSVCQIFGRKIGKRLSDFLLAHLRWAPDGLTRNQLYELCGRNRRADEIHEALELLREGGLARAVEEKPTSGPGRPTSRWFAIDVDDEGG